MDRRSSLAAAFAKPSRRGSTSLQSGRRDSTTLHSRARMKSQPPPPLINPYRLKNANESEKEQLRILQKHFNYHKNKSTQNPSRRFNLNFERLRQVNEGSFGTILHVRDRHTGLEYAVKKSKLKFKAASDIRDAFHEVFALSILDKCRYINRFYSAWVEDKLYIQLEYCHGGGVYQLFLKNCAKGKKDYPFTDAVCTRMLRHVTIALKYMHSKNIAHLDIKPENILIRGDKCDLLSADFVLGDFGNARSLDCKRQSIEHGDGQYLAPEMLNLQNQIDLVKVDVFGVGASMYELMQRKKLRGEWFNISKGVVKPCKDYNPKLMSLIRKMLNRHPVGRPEPAKILKDPIFGNTCNETEETKILREKLHECQQVLKEKQKEIDKLRARHRKN